MSTVSKIVSRIVLGAGAIGLALTPIAAQANTRAGDSARTYSAPASQPGAGRTVDGENVASAANLFALFMVGLWATGVVLAITDDDSDQSPGT